uniref:protein mono-ADP-ribosyltransferase PARP4 isoform X2 n=1 Tax=Gasterosteus aculeatus aculeatus TaxID=481459 RepID=UPI001A994C37|nr:protein mono-ADP-ribosyltransferase PARP4 isoform X2 [Gasterosteus aculeatus aculeatus]
MAVFEHSLLLLELKALTPTEKRKLRSAVTDNGGTICYVVNKQCSLVVTGNLADLSASRLRGIRRHGTPVVGVDYVYGCLERGFLLPADDYKLEASSPPPACPAAAAATPRHALAAPPVEPSQGSVGPGQRALSAGVREEFRIYTETDPDLPKYPLNFQVAKYCVFEKGNGGAWCVLELQSHAGEGARRYRVVRYWKDDVSAEAAAVRDALVFLSASEDAVEVYEAQRESLQAAGLQPRTSTPPQAPHLGSAPLQQLLLEERLNTGSLSQEVGVFVELLWTEALGRLGNILRVPIHKLSLNDVSRAEGLLLQAHSKLRGADGSEVASLLHEVHAVLLHVAPSQTPPTARLISQRLDLCQLIRDVLNVSEMTMGSSAPSSLGKYRAMRCSIDAVPPDSPEFQAVAALVRDSRVHVQRVLRVSRGAELQAFKSELGNIKPLLHSSSPSNFVGVLSRGLLLPRVGVEHHGIERTDVGSLGSGIYFSDAVSTSLKYSKPSETDGSRLLLVCDVALGRCKDEHKGDVTLTRAPEGHHSVHGVRRGPNAPSEFEDDEYVVYSPDQVKLKYVVQFAVEGDRLKEFSPAIDTSAQPAPPSCDRGWDDEEDVGSIRNPLAEAKAGLLDGSGQQLPLRAVHVRCKLMDLLSQVVVFQEYTNRGSAPIEAKYVFPLDDSAAVCGFEAFINGKHVVGQVKEKETARKEYKQAVEKGHGAYLMDQDAPDVFTISVGNLPPGASVLIKVTFVCELVVRDGSVLFSLPGSVAPWQEGAALNQTTQVTVEKVCVMFEEDREFTLDMSVEMPNKITDLQCITHRVRIKRTDCKAVVSVLPGELMGVDGFQLSITLSEVHLPRMWVEKHPDKDSQACMLVFYPDFEVESSSAPDEVVLLVDSSESMKGEPLLAARRIALQVLKTLGSHLRVNVLFFGTDHTEAFPTARPLGDARADAEVVVKLAPPVGGGTELWRPLRALGLLPPSRGVRNLLLLSDGHVQNAELALRLLRDGAGRSRLFACGLSPTANRHMLRALAQAGGGAYEFFDTKTKHNWAEKVARQVKRMASPGCSSVAVKWQQFSPTAASPVQAPRQLPALFNDCHALVYGFVPHCTQATLRGNLSGQELNTMVSTSELQKTRGTFLHKLTARALIRDHEDGSLDGDEAQHEGRKAELKRFIVELSKEFSILSQFTSFVAVEERNSTQTEEGVTDIPKLISEEDVDFLPYLDWTRTSPSEDESPVGCCLSMVEMDVEGTDVFLGDMATSHGLSSDVEEDYYPNACYDDIMMTESISPACSPPFTHKSEASNGAVCLKRRSERQKVREEVDSEEVSYCHPPASASSSSYYPPPRPFGGSLLQPQSAALHVLPPPPPPPPRPFRGSCGEPQSAALHVLPPPPPRPFLGSLGEPQPAAHHPIWPHYGSARSDLAFGSAFSGLQPVNQPAGSVLIDSVEVRTPWSSMGGVEDEPQCPGERLESDLETCFLATNLDSPSPDISSQQQQLRVLADSVQSPKKKLFKQVEARSRRLASLIAGPEQSYLGSSCDGSMAEFPSLKQDQPMTVGPPVPSRRARRLSSSGIASNLPAVYGLYVSDRRCSMEHRSASHRRPQIGARAEPERLRLKWTNVFLMQHSEGFWELTTQLGELVNVDVDLFANEFLKNKGIRSLGVRAHTDILRLLATLLVLQLMRVEKLEEGKLLRTLFSLDESPPPRPARWEEVKRAVHWVCWADRRYPCVYSRLEFGLSWETSTRQLLGFEGLPPFSALRGLKLQLLAL